jgi:hypothetical protein
VIDTLKDISKKLSVPPRNVVFGIIKNEVFFQNLITDLISDRIKDEGTDSEGKKLRTDSSKIYAGAKVYSPFNKDKRNRSHVDLYQTGALLASGKVIVKRNVIIAKYKLKKSDGSVYDNFELSYPSEQDFEEKVFSLSDDDLEVFNEYLGKRLKDYYLQVLS